MTVRRLTAVDAQMYWMSAAVPNDQFLLYAFNAFDDGGVGDLDRALDVVRGRAQTCAEFGLRIADTGFWTYPVWAPREVAVDQIVVHNLGALDWQACLAAVADLTDEQLDATALTWRLHVFPSVGGLPGNGTGSVAVLQICHALADGTRASALAARLFGRDVDVPAVTAPAASGAALPWRAFAAGRAHRRLVRDTEAGLVPPQALSRPALTSNTRPDGARRLRTVVCPRGRFGASTVTVGVLAAVSAALAGHLREIGDDPAELGAEVPMARPGPPRAHNHFGNVGVGLYPGLAPQERAEAIAGDLHRRRRRAAHPAMESEAAAFATLPAPLLRWGTAQFDPDVRSPTVTGNTVVSSVNRGPADLRFGAATVVLTAGFPSLSPMMGVTHGVHGIGDTVAVSVHAADSAIGDIDAYVERLAHALSP
ncbi:WS/DGAT/MGAT family O-acyltransferase [Mycobacterium sp. ZZG]